MLRTVIKPLILTAAVTSLAGGCAPADEGSAEGLSTEGAALVHQRLTRQDYNGDGKSDPVLFKPDTGTWFVKLGGGAELRRQFGESTDVLVPADYDGDGKTDFAVARPRDQKLYATRSSGGTDIVLPTSVSAVWRPYPCETNGNGKADACSVACTFSGCFWTNVTDGGVTAPVTIFGSGPPEVAVPEDYDGDGITDLATFQTSTGTWKIRRSVDGFEQTFQFGESTDRLVPGDYDGDGKADIALFRPRTNRWHVHRSTGGADMVVDMGVASDRLVPSDYDGDGKTDFAVLRGSTFWFWYARRSGGGPDLESQYGDDSYVTPYAK